MIRDKDGRSLEIGGVADHVHILACLSPVAAVSNVIRELKANSSKWITEKFQRPFEWQKGYGAFTVSFDRTDTVARYIRNQEEHHRKVTFQEEYEDFLKRHQIEYRPGWLFEDEHHG